MASPLIRYPDRCVVLPPQFCASVEYYAVMAMYGHAVVDARMRYDKRFKSAHRCDIADTRVSLSLTVPVKKPQAGTSGLTWADIEVSAHDEWWTTHVVTLESAYGRTPFFEFYFDRFRPLISYRAAMSVAEFDMRLDAEIRRILGLDTIVGIDASRIDASCADDYRRRPLPAVKAVPYYQVREEKLGFKPHLSVLDLIFNMGPEAPMVLREMCL